MKRTADSVDVAIIPMAGVGSRLYPLTTIAPKQLLPVIDAPVLSYILRQVIDAGLREFIFVTKPKSKEITHYILNQFIPHAKTKINVSFSVQKEPRGLANAILCAKTLVRDRPFMVILPDIIFNLTEKNDTERLIKEFHHQPGNYIGVSIISEENRNKYGMIKFHHKNDQYLIDSLIEKPALGKAPSNLGAIGQYIFMPYFFKVLAKSKKYPKEIQLMKAINELILHEPVYASIFRNQHFDCGSFEGYFDAIIHIGYQHPKYRAILDDFINSIS